jgi:hypothetical protein
MNLPNDPISQKLSENLADKLSNDLKEVFFSAIGENNTLHMIVAFYDADHKKEFLNILSSNEFVKNIEKVKLQFIPKGLRMFDFNAEKLLDKIQISNKKSNKNKQDPESENLGEVISLDSQKLDSVPKYNTKDEKKDSDEMIPL